MSAELEAMSVTCWGTRGSIPAPGGETVRFGGNTSCVEVRVRGRRLVLDAGTGIRALGRHLARQGSVDLDIFLTHFHSDHIQGFPFFAPLHQGGTVLRIHGALPSGDAVRAALMQSLHPPYFPVPPGDLAARLLITSLQEVPWQDDAIDIATLPVRHPGGAVGYRVRCGGASLAYVPDNELEGGDYAFGADWADRLVEFLADVDLLIHDAMFTDAEYPGRTGWGHSTFAQAVRLAEAAGVARLLLFHHAPDRSDDELARILDAIRAELAGRGVRLRVDAAMEGSTIDLPIGEAAPRRGLLAG